MRSSRRIQVDVLHAKLQTLIDPRTRSVKHRRNQPGRAIQSRQYRLDFGAAQYDRQVDRSFGAYHTRQPRQLKAQRIAVQEQDGGQRLILRGCGNLVIRLPMT